MIAGVAQFLDRLLAQVGVLQHETPHRAHPQRRIALRAQFQNAPGVGLEHLHLVLAAGDDSQVDQRREVSRIQGEEPFPRLARIMQRPAKHRGMMEQQLAELVPGLHIIRMAADDAAVEMLCTVHVAA